MLHHHVDGLRRSRGHRAADGGDRIGRAGVPVREVAVTETWNAPSTQMSRWPRASSRAIGMVEVSAAGQERHGLLAGVDEVGSSRPLSGRAHQQAVLAVQEDLAILRQEVSHDRRQADAEIHVAPSGMSRATRVAICSGSGSSSFPSCAGFATRIHRGYYDAPDENSRVTIASGSGSPAERLPAPRNRALRRRAP